MSDYAGFTGVLTAVRHMKGNGDVQFTVTVPKEMANESLDRVGGFPDPAESRWVVVARYNPNAQA